MGKRALTLRLSAVLPAVVAVCAGCTDAGIDTTPATNPTLPPSGWAPITELGPCHHVTVSPSYTSGGYVAAFDWDDDVHAYGEAVPLTGCFSAAVVAVPEGPPGVTFDPVQQQVPDEEFGVVSFTVTVPEGVTGPIYVRLDNKDGGTFATGTPGPVITPSGDGWTFTSPPDEKTAAHSYSEVAHQGRDSASVEFYAIEVHHGDH